MIINTLFMSMVMHAQVHTHIEPIFWDMVLFISNISNILLLFLYNFGNFLRDKFINVIILLLLLVIVSNLFFFLFVSTLDIIINIKILLQLFQISVSSLTFFLLLHLICYLAFVMWHSIRFTYVIVILCTYEMEFSFF